MNHTFICCGFAEVPPEVQSSDSLDGPQSEGRSSPIDRSWFGKEETALESPTPVHPEPIRPSVAPTQSYYLNGELPVCLTSFSAIVQLLIGEVKHVFLCVSVCAPSEPHMAGFPPYYKPAYAWESVPSSYELRQMSFSPTVLQHTSNLYNSHVSRSAQPQQPLDCSTHYSPTSNTYHCITCDKVLPTT